MKRGNLWAATGMRQVTAFEVEQMIAEATATATARAAAQAATPIPTAPEPPPATRGTVLTREEVADLLKVSTKTVQRWDTNGTLPRCPGFGSLVRYSTSDVLRRCSAPNRKGA